MASFGVSAVILVLAEIRNSLSVTFRFRPKGKNSFRSYTREEIPTLNYFLTPVVVIVVGTWFVAHSFMGVYAMAVDTVFLCFLEDSERNDGSPDRPYFMSKGLQEVTNKMLKFNDGRD